MLEGLQWLLYIRRGLSMVGCSSSLQVRGSEVRGTVALQPCQQPHVETFYHSTTKGVDYLGFKEYFLP
jgi:hypothetical protein